MGAMVKRRDDVLRLQSRVPLMEKEIHTLENEVSQAAERRSVLATANDERLAAWRGQLEAELPSRQEALRRALAAERKALEARQGALEQRRQGEQGAALRQVTLEAEAEGGRECFCGNREQIAGWQRPPLVGVADDGGKPVLCSDGTFPWPR